LFILQDAFMYLLQDVEFVAQLVQPFRLKVSHSRRGRRTTRACIAASRGGACSRGRGRAVAGGVALEGQRVQRVGIACSRVLVGTNGGGACAARGAVVVIGPAVGRGASVREFAPCGREHIEVDGNWIHQVAEHGAGVDQRSHLRAGWDGGAFQVDVVEEEVRGEGCGVDRLAARAVQRIVGDNPVGGSGYAA